jgi:hypothetical protein
MQHEERVEARHVAAVGLTRAVARVNQDQALGMIDQVGIDRVRAPPLLVEQDPARRRMVATCEELAICRTWQLPVPVWIAAIFNEERQCAGT